MCIGYSDYYNCGTCHYQYKKHIRLAPCGLAVCGLPSQQCFTPRDTYHTGECGNCQTKRLAKGKAESKEFTRLNKQG